MRLVLSGNPISISSFLALFFTLLGHGAIIHGCRKGKKAIMIINSTGMIFFQLANKSTVI